MFSYFTRTSVDLQTARERNAELKAKEEKLLKEIKDLESVIKSNSLEAAESNKKLLVLLNDVPKQRRKNNQNEQALEIANEIKDFVDSSVSNINSLHQSSMTELEQISERLSTEDLQTLVEELVKKRMNIAEQNETIVQLQKEKKSLECDIQDFKCQTPHSVHYFQEEFNEYRIREETHLTDFKQVKSELVKLKNEMSLVFAENKKDCGREDKAGGDVENLVVRLKFWGQDTAELDRLKIEKELIEDRLLNWQHEAEICKQRIEHLKKILNELNCRAEMKQKFQRNLDDNLNQLLAEEVKLTRKREEVKKDTNEMELRYINHLISFQESLDEKDKVINTYTTLLESSTKIQKNYELQNEQLEKIEELELEVANLEEQIKIYRDCN